MRKILFTAAALLSFSFGAAWAAQTPAKMPAQMPAGVHVKEVTVPPTGAVKVLADARGMTLYTNDNDAGGKSTCAGECARFWPPLAAAGDAKPMGAWSVISRDDGAKQWAYQGKPLYTFIKDTRVEDFSGNEQPKDKPVWHCALPGK